MKLPFEQQSLHEEKLREYFEEFEYPRGIEPLGRPVCILLFTNRSGSSMISDHMRATDRFVGFGEPLNYKRVVEISAASGFRNFAEYLRWHVEFQLEQKNDAVFGMKASFGQAFMLMRYGAIPAFFDDVRWVVVHRDDLLAQAISFSIANQTMQWHSFDNGNAREPEYDYEDIRVRLRGFAQSHLAIDTFCATFDLRPYRVSYEEFSSDPTGETRKLAAFLGVDNVAMDTSLVQMEPQRNERNAQFRARFIEDSNSRLRSGDF